MPNDKTPLWVIPLVIVLGIGVLYFLDHRWQLEFFKSIGNKDGGIHTMDVDEGEERPPVVVSSGGSVKFEAQDYGFGHGQVEHDTTKDEMHHKFFGKNGPVRLALLPVNASCDANPGADKFYEPMGDATIKYSTKSNGDHKVTISVKKAMLNFKTDKDTEVFETDSGNLYTMYLHHTEPEAKLLELSFKVKNPDGGQPIDVRCTFNPDGRQAVGVYQPIK